MQKSATNPSPQACLACRGKHLRCDGVKPVCRRCNENRLDCIWVQSKRGYVGGRRKKTDHSARATEGMSDTYTTGMQEPSVGMLPNALSPAGSGHSSSSTESTIQRLSIPEVDQAGERLIDTYYQYIHPAHPFLIPRKLYIQDVTVLPNYLKGVMRFIACNHTAEDPAPYQAQAQHILNSDLPVDVTKVQTMLLFTIVSFARCEREAGTRALTQAIETAYAIGLDQESFGAGGTSLFRESWRRTWWELYTMTGLISLVSGTNLRLKPPEGRLLPCPCEDYQEGRVTESRTLDDMQDRFFDDQFIWSSFAYRAEAVRLLSMVLELDPNELFFDSPSLDAASAAVRSFTMAMPVARAKGLRPDGTTDEVMSCAIMVISLASICLHLPRSELADVQNLATICNNERPPVLAIDRQMHTVASLRSADAISEMILARKSLDTITPCFSCALAFVVSSQLAAFSLQIDPRSPEANRLREYVQLALTTLANLSQSWQIAGIVRMQLARFAKDILKATRPDPVGFGVPAIVPANNPLLLQNSLENEMWLMEFINDTPVFNFNDPIPAQPLSVAAFAT